VFDFQSNQFEEKLTNFRLPKLTEYPAILAHPPHSWPIPNLIAYNTYSGKLT
jgi:hypothetical protein